MRALRDSTRPSRDDIGQERQESCKTRQRSSRLERGETLAGRVLANPRSTVKDKKLAAGVLSSAGKGKQTK
jgi:hypothetical protein